LNRNAFSDQAAKDVRSIFSRWYGFSAIGKAGWKKDPETGVIAPFDLYNVDSESAAPKNRSPNA